MSVSPWRGRSLRSRPEGCGTGGGRFAPDTQAMDAPRRSMEVAPARCGCVVPDEAGLNWPPAAESPSLRSKGSSMARGILTMIVTLGLLTAGNPCVWACQPAPATVHADAGSGSHCGDGSEPEAPGPAAPSHGECPGCALDSAATPASLEAPTAGFTAAFAGPLPPREFRGLMTRPGRGATRADRASPRDVFSITSSLRL